MRPYPAFVWAIAIIKRAAAEVNRDLGLLDATVAGAIINAADEVIAGRHADQFVVDPFQAGAGTSHNMNLNEVLADRANQILGYALDDTKKPVNPNDHVDIGAKRQRYHPACDSAYGALWRVNELLGVIDHLRRCARGQVHRIR
jgi:fumarate hydratase class II